MKEEKPEICPVCDSGELHPSSDMTPVDDFFIESVFSVCDECGCEITNQEQSEKNASIVKYMRERYPK